MKVALIYFLGVVLALVGTHLGFVPLTIIGMVVVFIPVALTTREAIRGSP